MKTVYEVKLNGRLGYYRTVTRKTIESVKSEAVKMYPRQKVEVKKTSMTEVEAKRGNAMIIAGMPL